MLILGGTRGEIVAHNTKSQDVMGLVRTNIASLRRAIARMLPKHDEGNLLGGFDTARYREKIYSRRINGLDEQLGPLREVSSALGAINGMMISEEHGRRFRKPMSRKDDSITVPGNPKTVGDMISAAKALVNMKFDVFKGKVGGLIGSEKDCRDCNNGVIVSKLKGLEGFLTALEGICKRLASAERDSRDAMLIGSSDTGLTVKIGAVLSEIPTIKGRISKERNRERRKTLEAKLEELERKLAVAQAKLMSPSEKEMGYYNSVSEVLRLVDLDDFKVQLKELGTKVQRSREVMEHFRRRKGKSSEMTLQEAAEILAGADKSFNQEPLKAIRGEKERRARKTLKVGVGHMNKVSKWLAEAESGCDELFEAMKAVVRGRKALRKHVEVESNGKTAFVVNPVYIRVMGIAGGLVREDSDGTVTVVGLESTVKADIGAVEKAIAQNEANINRLGSPR